MSVQENKLRALSRKASLRAALAPFAAVCIGVFTLSNAQANTPSNFYDYLEQGYLEIAGYASGQAQDAAQSKHFAGKAQLAAAEQPVEPDMPNNAGLPQDLRSEMLAARERLNNAIAAGAQEIDPLSTAIAQVNLDCWLAQFDGAASSGSDACRLLFYSTIAKLPSTVAASPYATLAGGTLAVTSGPISAVGGPTGPTTGSAPGTVGGVISAVGGPLQNLGRALDDTVASTNGTADGTVDDTTGTTTGATDGALADVSDTAGGALGGVNDGVGGAVADAGGAVGGALGGGGTSGSSSSGGGLGGLGGALGGLGGGLGGGGGGLGGGLGGGGGE